jgi:hypothetical protein
MCACTESYVRESATRLHSNRPICFTLGLKVRQCALLSALLTRSAIGSYSSDPREKLFWLHAPCPVSSLVERTVVLSSCEKGNEPLDSVKYWVISGVAK